MDQEFNPPQIVVCFPHYKNENRGNDELMIIAQHLHNKTDSKCELCENLRNKSWDVWNINRTYYDSYSPENLYNALSLAFVEKLLISNETEGNVLDEKFSPWNQPIFSSAFNFFFWQSDIDYYFKPHNLVFGFSLSKMLNNHQSKLDLLHTETLKALCKQLDFQEWDHRNEWTPLLAINKTCENFLLNASVPITFELEGMWFPLPQTHVPMSREYKFAALKNASHSLWNPSDTNRKPFVVIADTGGQYANKLDVMPSQLCSTPSGKLGYFIIIRYSVQMRARETRPDKMLSCHNESTPSACAIKCTKLWIIDHCGCVPLMTRTGLPASSSLPYCTSEIYAACDAQSMPNEEKEKCNKKCKNACQYTSYNWQVSLQNYESDGIEFKLHVEPLFDAFSEFSWTTKYTPEQFLSQTCGMLNFYLGLSGLSLFAVIISCIDLLKRLRSKSARKNDIEGNLETDLPMGFQGKKLAWQEHGITRIEKIGGEEKWISDLKAEIRAELRAEFKWH